MPFKAAPGFNVRLRDAMHVNGLDTPEELAKAVQISIPTARTLLSKSTPYVDAVTLIRLCDRFQFSGRWLVNGAQPPQLRILADLEEQRLLEILRKVPADRRDTLFDRILELANEL